MKSIDITGKRSGRLVAIRFSHTQNKKSMWLCLCDCGKETITVVTNINNGSTKSCGCLRAETMGNIARKHGMTKTPTYISWQMMIVRCTYKYRKSYKRYGGRGIKVCDRWINSFENFLKDMGVRPKGLSIDRKNNDGNYTPENCKWSTQTEQVRNSTTVKLTEGKIRKIRFLVLNGVTKAKTARIFKIGETTVRDIVNYKTWRDIK